MMSDQSDYNVLVYKVEQLEKLVANHETEIAAIQKEEKRKLMWGISVLGSAVLALVGVIWAYRGVIFRGAQ